MLRRGGQESRRHPHSNQGFSLLEVLIALSVVAIGLLAAVHATVGGQREFGLALDRDRAVLLADEHMREIVTAGKAAWINGAGQLEDHFVWSLQSETAGEESLAKYWVLRLTVERKGGGSITLERVVRP